MTRFERLFGASEIGFPYIFERSLRTLPWATQLHEADSCQEFLASSSPVAKAAAGQLRYSFGSLEVFQAHRASGAGAASTETLSTDCTLGKEGRCEQSKVALTGVQSCSTEGPRDVKKDLACSKSRGLNHNPY